MHHWSSSTSPKPEARASSSHCRTPVLKVVILTYAWVSNTESAQLHAQTTSVFLGTTRITCVTSTPILRLRNVFAFSGSQWTAWLASSSTNIPFTDLATCTAEYANSWIIRKLHMAQNNPFMLGCHFLPQTDFPCDRWIQFDNLRMEYEALLTSHGYTSSLKAHSRKSTVCPGITVESIGAEARGLIRTIYENDYQLVDSNYLLPVVA